MSQQSATPGSGQQETRLHEVDGVVVYCRKDERGAPSAIDAIDQDEGKIRDIADRLHRLGYGVMRERNPPRRQGLPHVQGDLGRTGRPPRRPVRVIPSIEASTPRHP